MKYSITFTTVVTSLLITSFIVSKRSTAQVFDPKGELQEQLRQPAPKQIRMYVETIEISALEYAELMTTPSNSNNHTELRNKLLAKAKAGKATLISCQSLVSRSGEKAATESIREFIYATEAEPGETFRPRKEDTAEQIASFPVLPPTPTAFETRNLGHTLELEPTLGDDGLTIDLRFAPESIKHVDDNVFSVWKTKHANVKVQMPTFYTMRTNTAVTVTDGHFLLVNTFSPDKDGQVDHSRKRLQFLRAEILNVTR